MEDLSSRADGSLTVTSQSAGNMTSARPRAMSAPGSEPVDPLPPASKQGDPGLDVTDYTAPNRVHGEGEAPERSWTRPGG